MSIAFKIPVFTSIAGVPALLLTTSTTIDWDNRNHARWVEVYFEDKNGNGNSEKIRVWIEDLGNLSKYSYFKKSENKWISYRYLRTSDPDSKKYFLLANIATEFLLNQHKLNVLKGISISEEKSTVSLASSFNCLWGCSSSCTQSYLESKHKDFFKELRNLESAWTGNYWSPVTAYIKFKELEFSSLKDQKDNNSMHGSMVYGSVNYDYKASSNTKYFANYPSKFAFSVGDDGRLKKGTNGNDLLSVSSKLKKWKTMHSKQTHIYRHCCCNNSDNSFECLLGSNFVKEYSDLGTIKTGVTSSSNGCSDAS